MPPLAGTFAARDKHTEFVMLCVLLGPSCALHAHSAQYSNRATSVPIEKTYNERMCLQCSHYRTQCFLCYCTLDEKKVTWFRANEKIREPVALLMANQQLC